MKIRYVLNHVFGGGGTIATTIATANQLARQGHDVEIASVVRRVETGRFEIDARVSVVFLTDGRAGQPDAADSEAAQPSQIAPGDERRSRVYSLLTDRRLRDYLSQAEGVVMGTRPALNIAVAQWAQGAIRIGQEHLNLQRHRDSGRAESLAAMQRWYPELDAIVTLTEQDAQDYRTFVPGVRIVSIPNAVNTLTLGLQSDTTGKEVISAGRLTGQKGFDRLISAYSRIARDFPDWRLRIYGTGPGREPLADRIRETGMEPYIELAGFSDDLPGRMAEAGVLAMTSRFEGLPMVMLEAMGIGLPLVAYDFRSGARDLIQPEANGVLVPEGDEAGFAKALAAVMADDELRAQMGARSRELAVGYRPEALAERWEQLIRQLQTGSPRGDRHGPPRGDRHGPPQSPA